MLFSEAQIYDIKCTFLRSNQSFASYKTRPAFRFNLLFFEEKTKGFPLQSGLEAMSVHLFKVLRRLE